MLTAILVILPIAALLISLFVAYKKHGKGMPAKKALAMNLIAFVFIAVVSVSLSLTAGAAGAEATTAASQTAAATAAAAPVNSLGLFAAAMVTSVAGIAAAIAIAAAAPAAIGAISEDPKVFGKALIFVALGEAIALYGVIISILILGKL